MRDVALFLIQDNESWIYKFFQIKFDRSSVLDVLIRIKRLVIARRVVFSAKAREERLTCGLSVEEILESILNAPTINKTLRSTSHFRKSRKEKLYVIISSTYDGKVIYTKGTIRKLNQREDFYILISSKWSSYD